MPQDPEAKFYLFPFSLYEKLKNIENPEKNFWWLKGIAQEGNAEAQFYLSILYLTGQGIEQSENLAFQYAKLAADQNMAEAQYNLALFF